MTEYFILVEYVKCIIPAMYGIFQVVLARLPNAIYYPSLANATQLDLHRAQTNVAVFVSMEVLSGAFVLLLNRRLHFSVLHQLAFVLETAADDIQAKLAMFIPYCFFFFLQHNGTYSTWGIAGVGRQGWHVMLNKMLGCFAVAWQVSTIPSSSNGESTALEAQGKFEQGARRPSAVRSVTTYWY